jgi:hypothetical protein
MVYQFHRDYNNGGDFSKDADAAPYFGSNILLKNISLNFSTYKIPMRRGRKKIAYVANSRPNKLSKARSSEGILRFSSSNQASSNLLPSFFDS